MQVGTVKKTQKYKSVMIVSIVSSRKIKTRNECKHSKKALKYILNDGEYSKKELKYKYDLMINILKSLDK